MHIFWLCSLIRVTAKRVIFIIYISDASICENRASAVIAKAWRYFKKRRALQTLANNNTPPLSSLWQRFCVERARLLKLKPKLVESIAHSENHSGTFTESNILYFKC